MLITDEDSLFLHLGRARAAANLEKQEDLIISGDRTAPSCILAQLTARSSSVLPISICKHDAILTKEHYSTLNTLDPLTLCHPLCVQLPSHSPPQGRHSPS